jgi:type III pantothenate kinase
VRLLVDVGNSRIKWALASAGALRPGPGRTYTSAVLPDLMDALWGDLPRPTSVRLCNVAGDAVAAPMADWVAQRWGCPLSTATPAPEAYGVTCAYAHPERLGADRWAALVAARDLVGGPTCVVDLGTAITLDALHASGRHLGGLIAPGLGLMGQSLHRGTHAGYRLPLDNAWGNALALGTDTAQGVTAGTLYAAVGLIERAMADLTERLGAVPRLLLSGGDAPRVLPHLRLPVQHVPELVLLGLAVMERDP